MWKFFLEPGKLQISIQCIGIAFCLTKDTNTHPEYSTYRFSIVTMVARSRLDVTSYVLCLFVFERYNCVRVLTPLKIYKASYTFICTLGNYGHMCVFLYIQLLLTIFNTP
jgi:hypothetical protein